ncbi:YihY/virulence factor BrkB family protein [Dokdonia sinensis]|uniref:YihY/virulence factor BrkB family protein n=1 Tax=Dokdonia sinensis TaxID=2479847 RepID=A0A3M0G7A7_9FLAO|nr:YihY/virulence factor BrkB family protein [Dokdonia sinensis]RMB60930.1 YihY/virulence factor BrkB family protein [Dokdonia sinensis]
MAEKTLEEKLMRFKPFCYIVEGLQKIVLPGFEGMTAYDLTKTYFTGILEGALSSRASSIAYSFFMALFPALLFLLNLIPYVPIDDFNLKFMAFIYELIPSQSQGFFQPIISDIAQNERAGLLSFAGILALFLMANGVNAIFSGFEGSFNVHINRSFFRQYAIALSVSIILALLLVTTITVLVYFEYVLNSLRDRDFMSDDTDIVLLSVGSYIFFTIMIYVTVATLYYFGTKEGKHSRFFSPGALMTTLLFMLTTYLFGVYIDNFSNYNELYGSIGALLIMLLYIWINSNLILLGFELNAVLRKLRKSHQPLNK